MNLKLGVVAASDLKNFVQNPKVGASLKPGFGGGFFEGTLTVEERTGPGENAPIISKFELPVALAQVGVASG